LKILLGAVLGWLVANLGYVLRNRTRLKRWEKNTERSETGRLAGSEAFASKQPGSIAILLVHGYANSPDVWRHMRPDFDAAGISIHAMQLPGFMVTAADAAGTTEEDWYSAVEQAFTALKVDHAQVWIMAHSLGCGISLSLLHQQRIKPTGLVLFAPLIRVSSIRSPVLPVEFWHQFGKGLLFAPRIMENVFPPDVNDPEAAEILVQDRFIHRDVHDSLFAVTASLPDNGAFIDCPLLVFVAPNEKVVDLASIDTYCETATGPVQRVDDETAGHVIPVDRRWRSHLETAIDFIEKNAKADL